MDAIYNNKPMRFKNLIHFSYIQLNYSLQKDPLLGKIQCLQKLSPTNKCHHKRVQYQIHKKTIKGLGQQ